MHLLLAIVGSLLVGGMMGFVGGFVVGATESVPFDEARDFEDEDTWGA